VGYAEIGDLPCTSSSATCADTLLCSDFEDGFAPWGYRCNGDGLRCAPPVPEVTLEVEGQTACGGNQILRARTEGGTGPRQNAYVGKIFDVAPDQLHIRYQGLVPENSDRSGQGMVIIFTDGALDSLRFGFGSDEGQLRLSLVDTHYPFAAPTPRDVWVCYEIFLSNDAAEVWVHGTSVFTHSGPTKLPGQTFDGVTLGITASLAGPTTFLADNFAVSSERLGCP